MPHNHALEAAVDRWSERLLANGFCVIPDLWPAEDIAPFDAVDEHAARQRRPLAA